MSTKFYFLGIFIVKDKPIFMKKIYTTKYFFTNKSEWDVKFKVFFKIKKKSHFFWLHFFYFSRSLFHWFLQHIFCFLNSVWPFIRKNFLLVFLSPSITFKKPAISWLMFWQLLSYIGTKLWN